MRHAGGVVEHRRGVIGLGCKRIPLRNSRRTLKGIADAVGSNQRRVIKCDEQNDKHKEKILWWVPAVRHAISACTTKQ